jgi:excisionase family DNA binding protein
MPRPSVLPPTLAPRLLSREQAAAYLSVSPSKFDQLVDDGRMPRPRVIDRRRAWDIRSLDSAIDDLPVDGVDDADASWSDVDAS